MKQKTGLTATDSNEAGFINIRLY